MSKEEILQLVCFKIGEEEFGIKILNVQEIIKILEFTRVPRTHSYIMGVFNLRGNVIPLINLRIKFSLPDKKIDEDDKILVVNYNNEKIGFLIEELTESVRVSESNVEFSHESILKDKTNVEGIAKLQDRIITILKLDNLLDN